MSGKMPKKWGKYSAIGNRIQGTCFVPFKVPLDENYFVHRPDYDVFTPAVLLDKVSALRTVIDLTNTSRFYRPQELTNRNVRYRKIPCETHGGRILPSDRVICNFFAAVDDHLSLNREQGTDWLIGVHCTHGVNRTGYLICKYMVTRLRYSPSAALLAFSVARGHPVERAVYIEHLHRCHPNRAPSGNGRHQGQGVVEREHGHNNNNTSRRAPSGDWRRRGQGVDTPWRQSGRRQPTPPRHSQRRRRQQQQIGGEQWPADWRRQH